MQLGQAGVGGGAGTKPSRLTVLGSGSVGLAFAACYAQAGQQVTLLARGVAVPVLRRLAQQAGADLVRARESVHTAPPQLLPERCAQP